MNICMSSGCLSVINLIEECRVRVMVMLFNDISIILCR